MNSRRKQGSSMAFVMAGTLVVGMIGVGATYAMLGMGDIRQSQNVADAGLLEVAQAATIPGVPLKDDFERECFGAYVNNKGEVTVETYNRLIGHAMLTGIKAKKIAEMPSAPTAAVKDAERVLAAANDIGKRLADKLSDSAFLKARFEKITLANNGKIKIKSLDVQVGFVGIDEPTNIYFDDRMGIKPEKFRIKLTKTGKKHVAGYSKISIPGIQGEVMGVPVAPDEQPHLVSNRSFISRDQAVALGKFPKHAVPNAFMITTQIVDEKTKLITNKRGVAVVGVRDRQFPVSFPRGYVAVRNPRSYGSIKSIPSVDNVFNNELVSGIFLGGGQNGVVAFSTDRGLLRAWADYNRAPQGRPQPALKDKNGKPSIFLANGDPATSPEQLTDLTDMAAPITGCFASNVGGPGAVPEAAAMLPAFQRAYDREFIEHPGDNTQLTSVEQMKQTVWEAYRVAWPKWNTLSQQGQTVQQANVTAVVDVPSAVGPGYSSLTLFDKESIQPVNAKTAKFTEPGTIDKLAKQVGAGADKVMDDLKDQVRQIKPEASDGEIRAVVTANKLDIDSTQYIYMQDEKSRKLIASNTPPSWVNKPLRPDGKTKLHTSNDYGTIGNLANPPHELGIHDVLFYQNPDPNTTGRGYDQMGYCECSGYDNCVAAIEFRNVVTNINNSSVSQSGNVTQRGNGNFANTGIINGSVIVSNFFDVPAGPVRNTPVTFAQPN